MFSLLSFGVAYGAPSRAVGLRWDRWVAALVAGLTLFLTAWATPTLAAGAVEVTVGTSAGRSGGSTYQAAPTLNVLSPSSGPATGGTDMTLTGSGFVAGQTTISMGGVTVPAFFVTVDSEFSLRFTSPPHAAGRVDVTATTPAGTSAAASGGFTYQAVDESPTVTRVLPAAGRTDGGSTIIVNGTRFVPGATTVTIGGITLQASEVTTYSDQGLTFTAPAHAAGLVDLIVTTAKGSVTLPGGFQYMEAQGPVITRLERADGAPAGGDVVWIHGVNLSGATDVLFGGRSGDAVDVLTDGFVTVITPPGAPGTVDVQVVTPQGTSQAAAAARFTYLGEPVITSITEYDVRTRGFRVNGSNLLGITAAYIGGKPVLDWYPRGADHVDGSYVYIISAGTPKGVMRVDVVARAGGASFDYNFGTPPPDVYSISPEIGPASGGTVVTLTGAAFVAGSTTVTVGDVVIPAAEVTVDSTTSLSFTTPAHAAGPADVFVTTAGGSSATGSESFTFEADEAAPTITTVSPAAGPAAGGTTVTITGTGFAIGDTTVLLDGVSVPDVTVSSETSLTFTTPAHAAGAVTLSVTTPNGAASLEGGFTFQAGAEAPTITQALPAASSVDGGGMITVHGTKFVPGATTVTIGGITLQASEVTTYSAQGLNFTAPAHAAGLVDLIVTTANGSATLPGGFQYLEAQGPVITRMEPTDGTPAGGDPVYIWGVNLGEATDVLFDGQSVGVVDVLSDGFLAVSTPPGAPGAVDVQVVTPQGTSQAAAAARFTYLGEPVITSISEYDRRDGQFRVNGSNLLKIIAVDIDGKPVLEWFTRDADHVDGSYVYVNPGPPPYGVMTVRVITRAGGATFDYNFGTPPPDVYDISPDTGPANGGTVVTLTGTAFIADGTTVTVGDIVIPAAEVTVHSETSLSFTTPAHAAGAADVFVTTVGGSSPTGSDSFTFEANEAAPTVTTVSPASGPATGGTTVTITGTGFAIGDTTVLLDGVSVPDVTVSSATSLTFTTPAHAAGAVSVTVSTSAGASAALPAGFTYAAPAPVANPVSATVTYGSADNAITLDLEGGAAESVEIVVQAVNGVAIAAGTAITYTPNAGYVGTDSFTYRAINAAGPSDAALVSLTVSPPAAPTGIPLTAPPVAYNTGSAAATTFSVSATGDPTRYAIGASVSGAVVSISNAGEVTYTPPVGFRGNDSFTFTATNAGGVSSPATVTVPISDPTLSASLVGSGVRGAELTGVQITPAGGAAPYSCGASLASGALPAGVSISSNCALTGTPATSGAFNFTVNVTDSSAGTGPFTQGSGTLTLVIAAPTLSLSPASGALPGATAGAAYSQTFTAGGGTPPYAYSLTAGALPTGLALAGGTLSGTPTAVGTFNFTLTASDSASAGSGGPYTVSSAYSVVVTAPVILLTGTVPDGAVGSAYAATVTASGAVGLPGYAVTAGALPPGLTLTSSGAITGAPTAGGSFNFTITATDGATGPGAPYSGSQAYVLNIAAPTIAISPASLSDATVGAAYSRTITSSGGTAGYTYAVTAGALPAGLTLAADGTLSGTATAGGLFNFTITATDSSTGTGAPFSGSRAYALSVNAPTIVVDQTTLPNRAAGSPYNQTLTASGGTGPYVFAVTAGALPPGWTLAPTGELTGTSTETNTFTFTITATDSSTGTSSPFTGSRAYTINVGPPNFTLTAPTLSATVGQPYSGAFVAGGGTAPFVYSRFSGTIPPGLTLRTDGVLSGTPTASGTFNFAVAARDATTGPGSPFGVASGYTFTVAVPTLTLSPATLSDGAVGAAYAGNVSASGGVAPFSYAVTVGALPTGVALDPTSGALSGTPTAIGTFNFTITATDSSTGAGTPFSVSQGYAVTIGKGSQTISFGALSDASLSASPLTLSATASSGLSVSFFSDTTAICTVSGAGLTLLQTGTCTIRAEQAGGATWAAAPSISRSFTVTPTLMTISAAPANGLVVGGSYSQANTASSGVGPYDYRLGAGALVPGTSLDQATGVVSGTPAVAGSFSYTVRVTDSQSLSVETGVTTVTIARGTQFLAFTSTAPSAVVAGPSYEVTASTTSGLGVTFTLDGSSTGCTITGSTVSFAAPGTCVVNANQAGDSNWNAAAQVQQSFTVVANPPIAADVPDVAVAHNSTGAAIDLSGSLTGGAHTSIAIGSAPAHGTVTVAGDVVTYTPAAGYYGADSFTYTATGPGGTSAPATVSLTVAAPAAPTAAGLSGVVVTYNSTGAAIDLSGSVTGVHSGLAIGSAPAHGTVTVAGDVVTYTPAAGYYGADSFTYTATGPGGTSAPATVSLTVAAPAPPVVTPLPPRTGAMGEVTIDLGAQTTGVIDGFRVTVAAQHGTATVEAEVTASAASADSRSTAPGATVQYSLIYVPEPGFLGTDTVTLVAFGPGGDSAPATFTFQIPGKAPDLSGQAPSSGSVTFSPTAGLAGGPFQGLRITRAPDFGVAEVQGLSIVFTPGAANGGATSLDYVVELPFGSSAPGRISLISGLVPAAQALTARTIQGRPVTVRISDIPGGPFTAASVVSVSPETAGSAAVRPTGGEWELTFTPAGAFAGEAVTTYTLTNAFGTATSTVTVTVDARPDPSLDPDVRGVASAQVQSARRFADAQAGNVQRRLQDLHDGDNGSSNGLSLNLGLGGSADVDRDPRENLRRQLGQHHANDPGALGDDQAREMLGLDVWNGRRPDSDAVQPSNARMAAAPPRDPAQADDRRRSALGVWSAGSVEWGRQDAAGRRDDRFTTQGVTAGLDVRVSDRLIVGAAAGYGEDKARIGDNGSLTTGEGITGALYASWRPVEALYIDGLLGYTDLDFASRRWAAGLAGQADAYATGERSGDVRFASAAFGRVFTDATRTSDYYARVDMRDIELEGFTETGAGLSSLAWDGVWQTSLSAGLGASWRWTMDLGGRGVIVPAVRLEWSHEFEDMDAQGLRYADWAASPTYLIPLDAWSRDSLRLDLGAEWSLAERLMLGLGYRGSIGDASRSHGGELRIKYGW